FINSDSEPSDTLEEWMGELFANYSDGSFAQKVLVVTYSAPVAANWKVIVDIGQESYHFPFVHRRTIPNSYTSKNNPHAHFLSVRLYERHRWASVYANPDHKPTIAEALAFRYGPTVTQGTSGGDLLDPAARRDWGFDLIIIFPNSIITFGNGFY